ncbi:FixH family protein [Sphingomonas sp.]|uniref:FixH family protein n=1 Tax=Sphingomonas sp. TaxID=28214 RepID=UPI001D689C50|nr:FixH family protein [Sphingomonas sp.]MBX9796704.1 FixH family protein [Sphingomonas sp.]
MTGRFTGWHMLAIMLAGFGLIIAVNLIMARAAISTFGGEVVANSYVASQRYNDWLKAAAAQRALGWRAVARVDPAGRLHIIATDAAGKPFSARVVVTARHPLGRMPDQRIALHTRGTDHVAERALPPGRWLLHIEVDAAGRTARFADDVTA